MCVLLDADCPFPDKIGLSKNTATLLKQVEDRRSFHQAMMVRKLT